MNNETTTTKMGNTTTTKPPAVSAESHGSVLTLTFADGRTIEVDATAISEDIRHTAMMHGFKQKLLDAAAIARNTMTGASASLSDKFDLTEHRQLLNFAAGRKRVRDGSRPQARRLFERPAQ